MVRYEDLRAEPRATLQRIGALMGETFADSELDEAVAFGAFENLRKLERQGFFRQGGLTPAQRGGSRKLQGAPRQGRGLQGLFHRGAGRRAGGAGAHAPVADLRLRSARRARPPRGVRAAAARLPADVAARRRALEGAAPRPATPGRVWLLLGDKPGDNAQVEAVAEALGWPCERQDAAVAAALCDEKPRFRATLDHVDPARSAPLEPPWPDLVLTIGRRPSMAALWLKARSAGRTRVVLFGKPSGMMERFDLVVAGAEVQLPPRPNLVPIRLPLMRARASEIEAAVAAVAGASRSPAPPADRHPGGRADRAVRVRRPGQRAAVPARDRDRRRRGHAVRHHQPAHAARGRRGAAGRTAGRRRSCSSGRRRRRQPVSRAARPRPTAASSPATASR